LSREFRARLDELGRRKQRRLLLTMAASASPQTLRWLPTPLLLGTMDWINVMTYDYAGERSAQAAHHAPLFASSKLPPGRAMSTELTMRHLVDKRKLPADRLTIGLPLYGKGFGVAEPYASTAGATRAGRFGGNYARLHELRTDHGWRRIWDDETKNPWLLAPNGEGVIGYDDAQSLALKTQWAMSQGFRGVFFWQIAGDRLPDGTNPLQEAARETWAEATRARRQNAR
jgi:chitinase